MRHAVRLVSQQQRRPQATCSAVIGLFRCPEPSGSVRIKAFWPADTRACPRLGPSEAPAHPTRTHTVSTRRASAGATPRTLSSMSSPPKDACTSTFAGVLLRSSPILKTLPAQRRLSAGAPACDKSRPDAPCITYSNLSISDFLFKLCSVRTSQLCCRHTAPCRQPRAWSKVPSSGVPSSASVELSANTNLSFVWGRDRRVSRRRVARTEHGSYRGAPSAGRCLRSRPATCRSPTCRHDTGCVTL